MRAYVALLFALLAVQTPAQRGVIEGRVLRLGGSGPIADVLVTLTPSGPTVDSPPSLPQVIGPAPANLSAITDNDGRFRIAGLSPGRYTVRAQRDGYFAPPLNGSTLATASTAVTLQSGPTPLAVDLRLAKGGIISGRIRDPRGQLLPNMMVSAYRVSYSNGRKVWVTASSKVTDDRGDYRLFWLPPGEYYVGATPRQGGVAAGPQDSWERVFYPSATDPLAAVAVQVRDGAEVSGTDIELRESSSATFKISGLAINPTARVNPATGAVDRSVGGFILVPRIPGVLDTETPQTLTNAIPVGSRLNGEFEIRNVRPGLYDLYPQGPGFAVPNPEFVTVTAPGGVGTAIADVTGRIVATGAVSNRRIPISRTPVDVNRDITDLRIVLSEGVTLSGEVVASGGGNVRLDSIRMTLQPLDTTPLTFVTPVGAITVSSAGKFAVPNVPEARYWILIAGLPENAYVADIRQGGASVIDTGFALDSLALPLQILVNGSGATLDGYVQTGDRKPAINATVTLVPPPSRRGSMQRYKTTMTDEYGQFSLRGVAPGSYKLFAWESILPTAWLNAEFLAKFEEQGKTITVPSNSDVPLTLIPREDRNW